MSCNGNRFVCGLRKPQRFSFAPDKPSNPELHNENQKRLSDLLKARELQDQTFTPSNTSQVKSSIVHQLVTEAPMIVNTDYTPWTTPSATKSSFEFKSQ
jgi:hypothetical protein